MTATWLERAPARPSSPPDGSTAAPPARSRLSRLVRGGDDDPRWARPALIALLVATAVLYLWDLGASGWANSFYSAAVQAGSVSWKAFLFGSSDAANSITVDKPPASLWLMALSVRAFGLSSWSILVPQALLGVGTVALLHTTVKRRFGAAAGLIAGVTLALTPVATLMFRFDNPDALLVLLMVAAVWALQRALESGRTRWMVAVGAIVGLGFLTKQMQVLLVVPALAGTYLLAGPVRLRRRVGQLLAAGAGLVVAAGWWIALVELWPASSRPYIGGSQTNSILELTFGYNGFGRLTGDETGSVGGGGTSGGNWGATGITRLFTSDFGGQIAWLIPAALIVLVAGVVLAGRAPRTDRGRAMFVAWGGWLLVTGLTFSFMAGIFHAYYTVALAPAVAALVGMGSVVLWRRRSSLPASMVLAGTVALTSVWAYVLLSRSADFLPWLRYAVVVVGLAAAVVLALGSRLSGRVAAVAAGAALVASLAGPAAYAVQTAGTAHTGSIVTAGPSVAGSQGGPGGTRTGGQGGPAQGAPGGQTGTSRGSQSMTPPAGQGGPGASTSTGTSATTGTSSTQLQGAPTGARGETGGTGIGGLLDSTTPSAALTALLEKNASSYTWVAAAVGSQSASGYQLATQQPVMALGGFNGTDPSPTLAQFEAYVAAGKIHYLIASSGSGGSGSSGSSDSSQVVSWVESHYTATTVGGVTVYDLTSASS